MVVLQARLLNTIRYTGNPHLCVRGSARGEAEITDSMTGQLLASWIDERSVAQRRAVAMG
jgi:hypothetical protein